MTASEVSIVLPRYNGRGFISSVASRLAPLIGAGAELIVVDDGSSDGSWDSMQAQWGSETSIRLIRFDRNQGVAASRNAALEHTSRKYVWFADVDDDWSPNILDVATRAANRAGADIVLFGANLASDHESEGVQIDNFVAPGSYDARQIQVQMLRGRVHGFLWSKLFSRRLLRPEHFPAMSSQSDFVGVARALEDAVKIEVIQDVLYKHVERMGSISRAKNPKSENLLTAQKKFFSTISPEVASSSLGNYFRVWFVALAAVDTTSRYRADAETRSTAHTLARRELADIQLLRLVPLGPPSVAKAMLLRAAPRLYDLTYTLARSSVQVIRRKKNGK